MSTPGCANIGLDLWSHVACFLCAVDRHNLFQFLRTGGLLSTIHHPAATLQLFLTQAVAQEQIPPCSPWPRKRSVADEDIATLIDFGIPEADASALLVRFGSVEAVIDDTLSI
tara:strand:- start:138 stop:476 length:339 start_codon:yes stop_codon:yes gene_type:complete